MPLNRANPKRRQACQTPPGTPAGVPPAVPSISPPVDVAVTLTLEVELPGDLDRFRLPEAVAARLRHLLDRQDDGQPLTPDEYAEAEGLVNLADLLTLLGLRAKRLAP